MIETLGQRITRLRTEHNMSQGDLADALGISRQSVSKWETDTSTPELEKLIRLAELFNLSMDALILGKEESAEVPPVAEPVSSTPAQDHTSIKFGYQKQPISQTRKFVGLSLIMISAIFALICLLFFAWDGMVSAVILSSPLWGCGILCLTVRQHLGLWCSWLVFVIVTGYLYYATGTSRGAVWNPQFWQYSDPFRKITAVIENVLLFGLYLWTFLTFRGIRCPERFHFRLKPLVTAYIGVVCGYVCFYILLKIYIPHALMTSMAYAFDEVLAVFYRIFTFTVSAIDLLWILVLLLGARLLYNESKAAKQKTE